MRETKFRAWDKLMPFEKHWQVEEIRWDDYNEEKNECDNILRVGLVKLFDGSSEHTTRELKDIVLEQYTGLKDKNGKDIYEGDIIAFEGEPMFFAKTYKVVYKDFRLKLSSSKANEWDLNDLVADDNVAKGFEIIGNIHENKELL